MNLVLNKPCQLFGWRIANISFIWAQDLRKEFFPSFLIYWNLFWILCIQNSQINPTFCFFLCICSTHRQIQMENKDQNTYKIFGLRHCKILLSKCRFLEKHPRKFTSSMQIHAVWRNSSQSSLTRVRLAFCFDLGI